MSSAPPPPGYGAQPQPGYRAPPPPPGYGAPPPAYIAQPLPPGVSIKFGEHPVSLTCPYCGAQVITATEYKSGLITWDACGLVCLVGAMFSGLLWLGCCLIPCCVNACLDVHHSCPNCQRAVGKLDRLKNL